ncbi:hypothetical protein [Cellulosimicrobium sp. CUA-896]|uniref:hypothetical protein n=1 Tax=Cellulosimicrobium sp. CUA-896 TaxID=1517881 RepID=UPI0011151C6A|nr:hypothetical protein [Cellulosimicrobium sp. CUA-896]
MTDTCAPTDHRTWLDLLTADDAGDVLAAALGADGASLGTWRVDRVHARPGAEVTVGYDVVAARGDGAAEAGEYLLATTASLPPEAVGPGVARLDDGERVLHVWRHPADPLLPGLAVACDPAELTRRLRATGQDVRVDAVEIVAYRPLRRAVLRARTTRGAVYVKVVRPHRARALVRRHALLTERDAAVGGAAPDDPVLRDASPGAVRAHGASRGPPTASSSSRRRGAGRSPRSSPPLRPSGARRPSTRTRCCVRSRSCPSPRRR